MVMMKLKLKKINQAEKRELSITCPPCTRPPKKCTEEVLLKVHKFWVFAQWLLQGSIETPILIECLCRLSKVFWGVVDTKLAVN